MTKFVIEGIGKDYIPWVLDRTCVDRWIKTKDADAFYWARRLIKDEGIMCGASSGSVFKAALELA